MAQETIAGKNVAVDQEGYLANPEEWTKEIAGEMAKDIGIELTDKHLEVIDYLREQHAQGAQLSIRKVGKSGITDIKGLYKLFPGGPLKHSSKIAGIPKPSSCV